MAGVFGGLAPLPCAPGRRRLENVAKLPKRLPSTYSRAPRGRTYNHQPGAKRLGNRWGGRRRLPRAEPVESQ
eukprot:11204409-Lingulodinium_polyedra.AAC.1